jgi:hypothetical protein
MRLKGLMIAAVAALLATPAFAGDASCLWKFTPQANRDAVLAAALKDPQGAADLGAFLKGVDAKAMFKTCGVSATAPEPALFALSGYLVEVSAAQWLMANRVATQAQLDAGWAGIDPAVRRSVLDNAAALSKEPLPPAAFAQFLSHTGAPNLGSGDGFKATKPGQNLFLYLLGRAVRTANEGKY